VDLKAIGGLDCIDVQEDRVVIGALTTIRKIEVSDVIRAKLSLLAQAAGKLGSVQISNRATIGGNLCNAAPSAETAPALLCLESLMEITGPQSTRMVPLCDFFLGPGQTILQPGEVVTRVIVPLSRKASAGVYYKLSVRRAMDIVFMGVAVYLEVAGMTVHKARIGLGAVAPTPLRARRAEALVEGRLFTPEAAWAAGAQAAAESSPITDLRASAQYRREMVEALTSRGLREAYGEAGKGYDHGDDD
jgi:carbon-monoxide dehydrogenase medium subunit